MIIAKNTSNNTGIAVYGDYRDLEELYEALHAIVGKEEEYPAYVTARLRVLGVCYDIRHALMGNREMEFVENGLDDEKKKWLGVIAPDKNVYLKFHVFWPEMLFIIMALNDFVKLYARKNAKKGYDVMVDKRNIWDPSIAMVRVFQSSVTKCMKETVSDASFARMINMMNKDYTWLDHYATQYVDILNCRFLEMDKHKRMKNISTMAKRLAEFSDEYQQVKSQVFAAAREYNCPISEIRPNVEYPEDFEW